MGKEKGREKALHARARSDHIFQVIFILSYLQFRAARIVSVNYSMIVVHLILLAGNNHFDPQRSNWYLENDREMRYHPKTVLLFSSREIPACSKWENP